YYIERFEDRQSNPLPDWSVDAGAGSLRVSNGYLVVDGYAAAFLGDETWYNARIAFGDGVYEEVNEFHVMMHMQDERNYMGMSCSRSSGFLVCGGVEVVNGAESPVNGFGQGTRLCAEGQMECTIAFQVIDGRYSVAVNGQEVVAFTDSTFESGAVGFAVDGAYSVNYILVYEPPYGASTGYTLFRDDFDTDGWSAEVDDDDYAVVTKSVEGGVYRWEVEAKQGVVASEIREVLQTAETDGYPNRFAYSARTRQVSGPADAAHGLLFRARDYDNFYYFRVTNEGEAGLYALVENEWNELVTPVYTEAYKPGEVNELRVVTEAGRFSFWINGVYLFQANDSRFPLGSIGMAVELVEAGQVGEFEFDDVRIAVRAR
ncbi:MAG: hypothetical protein GX601_06360, partial [Anaerolineales bacterium]|nr:hypothetical protein [Anaerolineales bacterium]